MRRRFNELISIRSVLYLRYIPSIVFLVKNWFSLLLNYIGLTNKGDTYMFRNGINIKTADGTSSVTIVVVFIKKDYGDVPDNAVVVDIGANIGVYSLFASQFKGTRVYAYEPMPDNFRLLRANIAVNSLEGRIFPFQLAVSGRSEKRTLYLGSSPLHSFLPANESPFNALFSKQVDQEHIEVTCISLQEMFDANDIGQCDILKLDCEGAEFDILYNTPNEYFSRIKSIRLEYHSHLSDKKNTGASLIEFLQSKGFRVQKLKKGSEYQGDVWLENTK